MKSILIVILSILFLTSCVDNKKDIKEKTSKIEVLVKDQFTKANNTFKSFSQRFNTNPDIDGYTDKVKFQKITKVQEFPSKSLKKWFVVISVKQRIDDEVFDGYVINVYEEDIDGEGRFRTSSLSMSQPPFSIGEVDKRIKYYEKNKKWNFPSEPFR
jgi:hypothetical protein